MKIMSILLATASLAGASKVVLDDFNDPHKGQTLHGWRLGTSAKAGFWYGYNDWNHGKTGLGTGMIPDVVHDDTGFGRAVADDCGEGSPCLHVMFIGGTGYAYPFSGVGFNFLREGGDVNLLNMDSITFRARGKGSFRFKLMTKHITDDFDRKNYWADMGRTFKLAATWRRYVMSTEDILPQDGAPLADTATWEECADHTRKIHLTTPETFKAKDTIDLWIDDIVMHGVTSSVFGGTWDEDSASTRGAVRARRGSWITKSGSRLEWNPGLVRRLDVRDAEGNAVVSRDGGAGSIALAELPRGALFVRLFLASGGVRRMGFVNIR